MTLLNKKVNSRAKGKRREAEVVALHKSLGLTSRRRQQYCGTEGHDDVDCREMTEKFHIEVKGEQGLNMDKALQQAVDDAPSGKIPIVYHRKNDDLRWEVRRKLKVTMLATDFHRLLEEGGLYRKVYDWE